MKLRDLIDPADLRRAMDEKLVKVQYSGDGQRVYNYTDAAMYTEGAWDNPAVRICRGLIVDLFGNVTARSYDKFFNAEQKEAGDLTPYLDSLCEVTDKADGSMLNIHLDEWGEVRCATRGSFESDQAKAATKWLRDRWHVTNPETFKTHTLIAEWISPENRIVLDYGDKEGIVILGGRELATGDYLGPVQAAEIFKCPFEATEVIANSISLRDAMNLPDRPNREGYVIRLLKENVLLKRKQLDYVKMHKLVFGLSERVVWEHMLSGQNLFSLLAPLPDELHEWTKQVWNDLEVQARTIAHESAEDYDHIVASLAEGWTRKEFAEAALKSNHRALLFMLLDGKNTREAILKTLRPSGASRARVLSEDVA